MSGNRKGTLRNSQIMMTKGGKWNMAESLGLKDYKLMAVEAKR